MPEGRPTASSGEDSGDASADQLKRPSLFQPGTIGGVTIKNRIIMAAMTTRAADPDGFVTDDLIAYYKARAEGGIGLITLEMAAPETVGRHRKHELGIHNDKFIPGLQRLVSVLHGFGAKVAIQIGHAGGHTQKAIAGEQPIAPSSVPHVVQEGHFETVVPLEMSRERIERTIGSFVDAAARARRAGIDIVELHAAHGYLLSQFLTPVENLRSDEFGGALQNRARFSLEIIRRIKDQMPDYPLVIRINGDDFFPGGLSAGDAEEVAVLCVTAGADAVHMTGGHYRSLPDASIMIPPMACPEATFLDFAIALKSKVDVPVIAVGRLGDPELAQHVISEGHADFVALGRPLLADPEWATKAMSGRPVRRCIACNSCVDGMRSGGRLHCLVNPATGRESQLGNTEATQKLASSGRRIAVIGAGPSGLSYASLAGRENAVTIFEKNEKAGGSFRLAGLAPRFQNVQSNPAPMIRFIDGLEAENVRNGVLFRFNVDVENDLSVLDGFDDVVVASGASYRFGIGRLVSFALRSKFASLPGIRAISSHDAARNWFYYKARRSNERLASILRQRGHRVSVIGDAAKVGKATEAIFSAFRLALAQEK